MEKISQGEALYKTVQIKYLSHRNCAMQTYIYNQRQTSFKVPSLLT